MLLVNTGSRQGKEQYPIIRETLAEAGVRVSGIDIVSKKNPLSKAIAEAAQDGAPYVIVGGGDGTIRRAIGPAIEHNMKLGLLPLGTGNSLCNELGIGKIEEAVAAIAKGNSRKIDVGKVGKHYFGNVVTLGVSARIAIQLKQENKQLLGKLAYVTALLHCYTMIRPFHVSVKSDLENWEGRAYQVVLGAGGTHVGSIPISPMASFETGLIEGYIVKGEGRSDLFQYAAALVGRKPGLTESIIEIAGKKVTISTPRPVRVIVDGDPILKTPIDVECLPAALEVFAPPPEITGEDEE